MKKERLQELLNSKIEEMEQIISMNFKENWPDSQKFVLDNLIYNLQKAINWIENEDLI